MMKPYDPKRSYCGPGRGWMTNIITHMSWGVCLNRCCYEHDVAYERGGTGRDRYIADQMLRDCIEIQFSKKLWAPSFLGRTVARRYYVAVRVFGSIAFKYKEGSE